jgi:hypothetical protein
VNDVIRLLSLQCKHRPRGENQPTVSPYMARPVLNMRYGVSSNFKHKTLFFLYVNAFSQVLEFYSVTSLALRSVKSGVGTDD